MKNFALVGAAGYIAPRHMKAIYATGNRLVSATDPSDAVGILDSSSYDISFFTEFERFDRHAEKLRRLGDDEKIHYVSICSPNYLHDAHIRFALRIGADAICEKPLVLNPWNLDALAELEREYEKRIFTVLQLRYHPAIQALREQVSKDSRKEKHTIDLSYVTSRGKWYLRSWKGDIHKSGGVATNIGVHFFDMLIWIFGQVHYKELHFADEKKMAGYLELEKANVRWFLSVDNDDVPPSAKAAGNNTFRSITVDGEEVEFSGGFTDLHTVVYEHILAGHGYGIEDARPSINLVYELRNATPLNSSADRRHPLLKS
ncbi:MAG: Gfo/Idh/MocA family oxidoreductase [Deltaproteobacteria bacterium]|nr:Gfo/Idh/MocA family oxidoreductase [Candidatus Anaeroferrophillus wilburensis]MBN2889514.1 Gfo/Idh/MocA family oxidoreductase [Deltaproteobacteria bacterium]